MKKLLLLVLSLLFALTLASCGSEEAPPATETVDPLANSVKTEAPETEATEPQDPEYTDFPRKSIPKEADYDYYHVFKAPEGDPRDIVMDYMLKMAKVEWTPATTWTTGWKKEGYFKVNLTYEAGKTYYGVPYADTRAPLGEFQLFLKDGKFTPNSTYYEELIGNHCSSSMIMAYQQIIDLSYPAGLRPTTVRKGLLSFPEGIETPPSESTTSRNTWYSDSVLKFNTRDAIMDGYASLDKGDIVMKDTKSGGHTRMISKVEVSKTVTGKVNPGRSYVYCVEQTNAWFDNNKNSTWWIDKKYSFTQLYDNYFMPVTLDIFHEENPVIDDAVICMKGKNTPTSIVKMLNGTIESNFPLSYIYVTVRDTDGNTVCSHLEYNLGEVYKFALRKISYSLGIDKLENGKYTFKVDAGIARGDVTFEDFEFEIKK